MTRLLTNGEYAQPIVSVDSNGNPLPYNSGFSVPAVLTVTNGAYSIGDVVGGLITLANVFSAAGKRSVITMIALAGVAAIPYELWFFNAGIATPAADNAVFALAAADQAKFLAGVAIAAADYLAGGNSFNFATKDTYLLLKGASTSLFAYLKATAVTSPSTTTLNLTVNGFQVD